MFNFHQVLLNEFALPVLKLSFTSIMRDLNLKYIAFCLIEVDLRLQLEARISEIPGFAVTSLDIT